MTMFIIMNFLLSCTYNLRLVTTLTVPNLLLSMWSTCAIAGENFVPHATNFGSICVAPNMMKVVK